MDDFWVSPSEDLLLCVEDGMDDVQEDEIDDAQEPPEHRSLPNLLT